MRLVGATSSSFSDSACDSEQATDGKVDIKQTAYHRLQSLASRIQLLTLEGSVVRLATLLQQKRTKLVHRLVWGSIHQIRSSKPDDIHSSSMAILRCLVVCSYEVSEVLCSAHS